MRAPEWNTTRELLIEQGPVVIAQTRTDPGDMGEPRVFESDGTTYVSVPDFDGDWGVDDDLARALTYLRGAILGLPWGTAPASSEIVVSRDAVLRKLDQAAAL